MNLWLYLIAIAVGAGLTVQVGLNMQVGRGLGSPLWAVIINFMVGLAAMLCVAMASNTRPVWSGASQVPASAWLAGLLGAAYVGCVTVLGPRIGALTLLGMLLLGQLAAALLIDHLGILGFPRHAITAPRVIGTALLLLGVILASRQ